MGLYSLMDLLVLNHLTISNLRNITELVIQPSSGINLILGNNGSGKTTILEAIHLLTLGRSFRTRFLKNAVQFGQQRLQVIAKTTSDIPVGLQFDLNLGLQIRINSHPLKRLSDLATQLPLQLIPANCHQFFEQGPRYRRQLLDWGLFHVEPSFNYQWQSYRKVVLQRNSALRQHKKDQEIQLWDNHLADYGERITILRKKQLTTMLEKFSHIFPRLCPEFLAAEFSLQFKSGWPKEQSLFEVLNTNLERDKKLGYTRSGSHAADWSFNINGADPSEIFSRGQQKLFVLALSMAQAEITLSSAQHTRSILLIDDISSELDHHHQQIILTELAKLPVQSFISSTDFTLLKNLESDEVATVFHVEQGRINDA
jgi:DNA replication and repair protein RecF